MELEWHLHGVKFLLKLVLEWYRNKWCWNGVTVAKGIRSKQEGARGTHHKRYFLTPQSSLSDFTTISLKVHNMHSLNTQLLLFNTATLNPWDQICYSLTPRPSPNWQFLTSNPLLANTTPFFNFGVSAEMRGHNLGMSETVGHVNFGFQQTIDSRE